MTLNVPFALGKSLGLETMKTTYLLHPYQSLIPSPSLPLFPFLPSFPFHLSPPSYPFHQLLPSYTPLASSRLSQHLHRNVDLAETRCHRLGRQKPVQSPGYLPLSAPLPNQKPLVIACAKPEDLLEGDRDPGGVPGLDLRLSGPRLPTHEFLLPAPVFLRSPRRPSQRSCVVFLLMSRSACPTLQTL